MKSAVRLLTHFGGKTSKISSIKKQKLAILDLHVGHVGGEVQKNFISSIVGTSQRE